MHGHARLDGAGVVAGNAREGLAGIVRPEGIGERDVAGAHAAHAGLVIQGDLGFGEAPGGGARELEVDGLGLHAVGAGDPHADGHD